MPAPTRSGWSSAMRGTVYWSASAVYYDTATADARQGSRQLAITRKYALLTPVTVKDRIVYRESAFTGTAKPGDVLTVRLTVAGSPEWRYLALEDPLPAGVEAIQDTTAYPLEREAPRIVVVRLARRVSRFADGVLPGNVRARPLRVRVSRQGDRARTVPRGPGADLADVRAGRPRIIGAAGIHDRGCRSLRRGLAMRLALATLWILAGCALTARRLLGVPDHAGVHDLDADASSALLAHRASRSSA